MTEEKFEQARQLKNEITDLLVLDDVLLKASTKGHKLAVIDSEFDVLNAVFLSDDIFKHFRQIIAAEVLKLDRAFEAL